jgi:cyclopropane-fatty-acyl-phospholipid synthase
MILTSIAERGYLPDALIRVGIRRLLSARLRNEHRLGDSHSRTEELAESLRNSPVALATGEANAQHYEVPSEFFETVLGPRLKYSCCLYDNPQATLPEAEESMLRLSCRRAELKDGMDVLDLGCGWGSLALWIAEHYPHSRVTALSNSASQRRSIETNAHARGLRNVEVITADIADYLGDRTYDRIVSIEMFEHMRNYEVLLARIAGWLRPEGKLFVHVFCHRELAYTFDANSANDWMARHFFTAGLMPSFGFLGHFNRDLVVRRQWQIDGRHYARTCEDWLANLDAKRAELLSLFAMRYGRAQAYVRLQRWRMFFMACAELFGFNRGSEWFVEHYLLEPCHVAKAVGTGRFDATLGSL